MQENLEATLEKLVAFPSVTNNSVACHDILDFARSEFEQLGLFIHSSTDGSHPWMIATTQQTQTPDILLVAHLDVVPAAPDLFQLRKADDKLYGRGVYDMKFAAACYIEFAKAYASKLHTLNIGFMFTTDEEIGGTSVLHILEDGWRPRRVFIPDGGDNWEIEESAKGFFGLKFTATGKASHGSRPWEGSNAIHPLLAMCQAFQTAYPQKDEVDASFAITTFHAGVAVNQLPDDAYFTVDFRSFDNDELTTFLSYAHELAEIHGVTVNINQSGLPVHFDKQSPLVQDFVSALRETIKDDLSYRKSYGGSDARHFAIYNIPSIIIEPYGGGRHSPEEWILASDLEKYYRLIERWIIT